MLNIVCNMWEFFKWILLKKREMAPTLSLDYSLLYKIDLSHALSKTLAGDFFTYTVAHFWFPIVTIIFLILLFLSSMIKALGFFLCICMCFLYSESHLEKCVGVSVLGFRKWKVYMYLCQIYWKCTFYLTNYNLK